jgi:hypothetical protein
MSDGFGAGWMGAGWMGAGWMGAGWHGAGWHGAGWAGPGGGGGAFATRNDHPLAEIPVPANFAAIYPAKAWDADLHSLLILPQFLSIKVAGQSWDQAITVAAPAAPTQADIDEMLILAVTERPEAMGEILNQHSDQQNCFMQLLMMNGNTHPATFKAMKYAARVGEVVMMYFKDKFKLARPSQVCPTLYPPVPVPGHAAYPAGHAAIAHITAKCLIEITKKGVPPKSPYELALNTLADRIGLNRVIAGFHYRQDITAGAKLGTDAHAFMLNCQIYQDQVAAAKAEWP